MHERISVVALMLGFLAACGGGGATGPTTTLRTFGPGDTPIAASGVTADDGAWRIVRAGPGTVPLYEVPDPGVEQTILTYRAQMRTEDVAGTVYLELWVRLPGRGEFFSKGLNHAVSGTNGWASYEVPFFLQGDQRPDLVKLGVAFEGGGGTVWIRDVALSATPHGG